MFLNLRRGGRRPLHNPGRRRPAARRGACRPTLERLEGRECPSIAVTNLALSQTTINEGGSSTLTGNISGRSVGDLTLAINWGDGSAVQNVSLPAGSQSFSVPHTFLDDVGAGTSNV